MPGSTRRRHFSFGAHLVAFGLLVALPVTALAGALIMYSVNVEYAQAENRLQQLAAALSGNIERDVERHVLVLNTLSNLPTLGTDWRTFDDRARKALQGDGYIVVADASLRQLVNTYVPYGQQPARTGDVETAQRVLRSRGMQVSSVFTSLVTGGPVINIGIPIIRNGEVEYILMYGRPVSHLIPILRQQGLDPGWTSAVFDRRGTLITHSSGAAPMPLEGTAPRATGVSRLTDQAGNEILRAIDTSRVTGWTVSVDVPVAVVMREADSVLNWWLWLAIATLLLAVGLGFLFGRFLSGQLRSTAAFAGAIVREDEAPSPEKVTLKEIDLIVEALKGARTELQVHMERFRSAVESAPCGMVVSDAEGRIMLVNAQANRLFGYGRDELIGEEFEILVPERFRAGHLGLRASYRDRPTSRVMGAGRDLFARRKDGGEVQVEVGLSPIMTGEGIRVLAAVTDITERKKAQETERLLSAELQHRTRNLFAVIQSLVIRTLRGSPELEAARNGLVGRLQALARNDARLTNSDWTGAKLEDVIRSELGHVTDRARITGPEIVLTPAAAQNFALAVHELATNAAKYGSLSTQSGEIRIGWDVIAADGSGETLRFRWEESGGPPVAAPQRRGFGTSLLEATLGKGRVDYEVEGLVYEIELEIADITSGSAGVAAPAAGADNARVPPIA